MLAAVPDGVALLVAWYLPVPSLEALRLASVRWVRLATHDALWDAAATLRWEGKQLETAAPLIAAQASSRDVYWSVEEDGKRCLITDDDVARLRWAFSDGSQLCDFGRDHRLRMSSGMGGADGFQWSIDEESRAVMIANFPAHEVKRLENWGWVMKNEFIFIISVAMDGDEEAAPCGAAAAAEVRAAFDDACSGAGDAAAPLTSGDTAAGVLNHILRLLAVARRGRGLVPHGGGGGGVDGLRDAAGR